MYFEVKRKTDKSSPLPVPQYHWLKIINAIYTLCIHGRIFHDFWLHTFFFQVLNKQYTAEQGSSNKEWDLHRYHLPVTPMFLPRDFGLINLF
jgi:hypothetical protein